MLQRQQIIIEDWMIEFIKRFAKDINLSISEVTRVLICLSLSKMICLYFPECKTMIDEKEIMKKIKKDLKSNNTRKERSREISDILYETRKLIEYSLKKIN